VDSDFRIPDVLDLLSPPTNRCSWALLESSQSTRPATWVPHNGEADWSSDRVMVSKLTGVRAQGLDWNFLLSIEDVLPGFLLAEQQAACVAHQCRRSLSSPRSSSSYYPDLGCKISSAAGGKGCLCSAGPYVPRGFVRTLSRRDRLALERSLKSRPRKYCRLTGLRV
jgi:hypothetical protein